MRVVHIDKQRSWTGQINRGFNVGTGVREYGHDVAFIAHPGALLGERGRAAGFEVFTTPLRGWKLWPSVFRIAKWSRKNPIDILHCHGPRDHLASVLAAKLGKIGLVVRTKHNHTPLRNGFWSRLLFRNVPVATVSEHCRERLILDGIDPDTVRTIHTSVDVERFQPRPRNVELMAELGIDSSHTVIGNVSSLHKRKGIGEILQAFEILASDPNITLVLTGKNHERWQRVAEKLGIADRVVFPGFQTDVPAYLALLDLYILPSHEEGLGTSILEAMCMALPVLVSNAGGIPESVIPGTGVVLEDCSKEKLAAAIRELIDDPELRKTLGEAASKRVMAEFSVKTMVARMVAFYEELVPDKPANRPTSTSASA